MSQTPQQKKSRFQLSREVQEEFVNGIAQEHVVAGRKR